MKWIVLLIFLFILGCAAPPKKHHRAVVRHKTVQRKTVVKVKKSETTPNEDAAVDAIIKSLREDGDED